MSRLTVSTSPRERSLSRSALYVEGAGTPHCLHIVTPPVVHVGDDKAGDEKQEARRTVAFRSSLIEVPRNAAAGSASPPRDESQKESQKGRCRSVTIKARGMTKEGMFNAIVSVSADSGAGGVVVPALTRARSLSQLSPPSSPREVLQKMGSDRNGFAAAAAEAQGFVRDKYKGAKRYIHHGCTDVVREMMRTPVNVQEVKRLAALRPAAINLSNTKGFTAMHYATMLSDSRWTQSELVQLFLKKEACLYLPDFKRRTPVCWAMAEGLKSARYQSFSDSIRAYQQQCEGRVPFYNSNDGIINDEGFHRFSKVFKGERDDMPLIYSGSRTGFRVWEIRDTKPRLLQHYPGLTIEKFRTSVEKGSKMVADQELLVAENGCILRFRRCLKRSTARIKAHIASGYVSDLNTTPDDDSIVRGILPAEAAATRRGRGAGDSPRNAGGAKSPPGSPKGRAAAGAAAGATSPTAAAVSAAPTAAGTPTGLVPSLLEEVSEEAALFLQRRRGWADESVGASCEVSPAASESCMLAGESERSFRLRRMLPMPLAVDSGASPYKGMREGVDTGPSLEVVVEQNTAFLESVYSETAETTCDIYPMYWGPSVATLRATDGTGRLHAAATRFEFRVITILPTAENTFFSCGHLLSDPEWVSRNCHTAKRGVQGRPVAVRQVGNGDYVCLSDTCGSDRVLVFSPNLGNAFYPIKLSSPGRPVGLTSRTVRDVTVMDSEIPMIAVSTTQSIEVHTLTLTKSELAEMEKHGGAEGPDGSLANGRFSSHLMYHICNGVGAGQYACAFSQQGPHKLAIFRGGATWFDICICDTLTNHCYHVCKCDALREMGEKGVARVTVQLSEDGTAMMRGNISSRVSTVHQWSDILELLPSDHRKRVNMSFAETNYAMLNTEMFAVPPPEGKVTLVFTDVQSSTELWEREPAAMQQALELHNGLLRRIMLRFCGYEVKTEGDAFMVAFRHTMDALNWCLVSQILLLLLHYPQGILDIFPAIDNEVYDTAALSAEDRNNQEEEDDDVRETVSGIAVC